MKLCFNGTAHIYVRRYTYYVNNENFNVTCSRTEEYVSGKFRTVRWEEDCIEAYQEVAIREWYSEVKRVEAKCGKGRNKLRTYALFKEEWGYEPYLSCVNNRDRRVLLSKFRLGICRILSVAH